jgi:TRAP-type mannitol/chloroaromatic compound transport system permease small subunit
MRGLAAITPPVRGLRLLTWKREFIMNHNYGWMGGWMSGRMGGGVWIWPLSAVLMVALVVVVIMKVSRKKS